VNDQIVPPDSGNPNGIEPVNIVEEMERSYLDYAMENVDKLKKGEPVSDPDSIVKATIAADKK